MDIVQPFQPFLLVLIILVISWRCAKLGSEWKTLNPTRGFWFSVASIVLSLVGIVILYGATVEMLSE